MPSLGPRNPASFYWRSLDELADTPEFRRFVETEFPGLADQLARAGPTRRQFLKVMGASLALAGMAGCRWPKETIVPATRQPSDRVPGVPVQYATSVELDGVATGLLVTSYDGRPIKVEGNPLHPFSRGKSNALMQAGVLELYDPDRSVSVLQLDPGAAAPALRPAPARTWEEFAAAVGPAFDELRVRGGSGLAVLSEASTSPSFTDMRGRFRRVFPQARWFEWEPLTRDNEREGARLAFGRPLRPHLHLDRADVIVSLDSDFLCAHPASVRHAGDFAARRRPDDGTMSRLYVIESGLSLTGTVADHRLALAPAGVISAFQELQADLDGSGPAGQPLIAQMARDLRDARGRGLIIAGPGLPAELHALVYALNQTLGNVGQTLSFTADPDGERRAHVAAIGELVQRLRAGEIQALVILGGNPVYDAPAELDFAAALDKAPLRLHLSHYANETSQRCTWHLPRAHYLESWGDGRAWDGTVSLVQPLIEPLYDGRTPIELLALLSGDSLTRGYDIVRRTFQEQFARGGDFETTWRQCLHDGIVPETAWPVTDPPRATPAGESAALSRIVADAAAAAGMALVFRADYKVHDGRFANNGWLQELPDPITKTTWDNVAMVSPAEAARLGVRQTGDLLRLEVTTGETRRGLTMPAFILPGQPDGVVTVTLGYGRTAAAGMVADGAGFDTYTLRTSGTLYCAAGVSARAAGGTYPVAGTQDHHAIAQNAVSRQEEQERAGLLIREATLEEYKEHPEFAQHMVHHLPLLSLWNEKEYSGHKWGMTIDLNACIGCGACVVACQAENNIPVVGKEEVGRGREMHWIRVDRYFKASAEAAAGRYDDVRVAHQPVPCMHCELAPCEGVCPVAATVHDEEGLNVMVYNRCVGTRYCSNNCPYKVRRFNYFWNQHGPYHPRSRRAGRPEYPGKLPQLDLTPIEQMQRNPNVTVRSRGVMEKCTYCTQRINAVKIRARTEGWDRIADGLITPACAQACPTDAIVFGDLNDPDSRVRKLQEHARAYALLAELNIKPRTLYLARLRNPAVQT